MRGGPADGVGVQVAEALLLKGVRDNGDVLGRLAVEVEVEGDGEEEVLIGVCRVRLGFYVCESGLGDGDVEVRICLHEVLWRDIV